MSAPYQLRRTQWVPRPLHEVFEFFSDARNLELLTPGWLRFQILTPSPILIAPGTRIQYRLKWHGVPLRWTTEITKWDPPYAFEDFQLSGPYRLWHHFHNFESSGNGTLMTDVVNYELPLGVIGRLTHAVAVRKNVEQIFDFRHAQIRELFDVPERRTA